jgi:hypothetical protein
VGGLGMLALAGDRFRIDVPSRAVCIEPWTAEVTERPVLTELASRSATNGSSRDTGKTGHESILTPVSAGRHAVSGQP